MTVCWHFPKFQKKQSQCGHLLSNIYEWQSLFTSGNKTSQLSSQRIFNVKLQNRIFLFVNQLFYSYLKLECFGQLRRDIAKFLQRVGKSYSKAEPYSILEKVRNKKLCYWNQSIKRIKNFHVTKFFNILLTEFI